MSSISEETVTKDTFEVKKKSSCDNEYGDEVLLEAFNITNKDSKKKRKYKKRNKVGKERQNDKKQYKCAWDHIFKESILPSHFKNYFVYPPIILFPYPKHSNIETDKEC